MNLRLLGTVCIASACLALLAPVEAGAAPRAGKGTSRETVKTAREAAAKGRKAGRAQQLAERTRVLQPLEAAATACFAETIDANPTALAHAKAGRWYEAASVGGYLCRPEVAKLMRAHDVFDGPGSGARYFRGPYVRHLGGALAAKLEPDFARHAVADALPVEKASIGDASAEAVAKP